MEINWFEHFESLHYEYLVISYFLQDGDKLNDLQREKDILSTKLTDSQTKLANTERLLKEARHHGVEMKLRDEEALNEISVLKGRIDDLEKKLWVQKAFYNSSSIALFCLFFCYFNCRAKALEDVDMYQEKAMEYNNQIRQLRRQITDDRYVKSKREDDPYPSF